MLTLTLTAVGERLDKALSSAAPEFSRTQAQHLIESECVTINGQTITRPAYRLERVSTVQVQPPPPAPASHPAEAIPLAIVFENAEVLVINKPPGMVVHPAAGHPQGTLVNAVLGHDPDLEGVGDEQRPGIVHRLDRDTSGLIVVAKTNAAHHALQEQFRARTIDKRYLALLDGHPRTDSGRIEAAIGRHPQDRKRMALVSEARGGRMAYTEYRVLEKFPAHTLVEAQLLTGRTHQLRVHFAFLKCPIVGDTQYGRATPSLPLARQFLHAAQLQFDLPSTGERLNLTAPLPEDLARVLHQLRNPKARP